MAQHKIKRVLAYSSIGHAGFLMLGVLSFSFQGIASLFFYFTVYSLGSLGIFASIIYLTGKKEVLYFDDLKKVLVGTSRLLIFFLFRKLGWINLLQGAFIANSTCFMHEMEIFNF